METLDLVGFGRTVARCDDGRRADEAEVPADAEEYQGTPEIPQLDAPMGHHRTGHWMPSVASSDEKPQPMTMASGAPVIMKVIRA